MVLGPLAGLGLGRLTAGRWSSRHRCREPTGAFSRLLVVLRRQSLRRGHRRPSDRREAKNWPRHRKMSEAILEAWNHIKANWTSRKRLAFAAPSTSRPQATAVVAQLGRRSARAASGRRPDRERRLATTSGRLAGTGGSRRKPGPAGDRATVPLGVASCVRAGDYRCRMTIGRAEIRRL